MYVCSYHYFEHYTGRDSTNPQPQLLRLIILLLIKQRRNISLTTQQHARCIQMHFLTNRFQQRNLRPFFILPQNQKKSKYQIQLKSNSLLRSLRSLHKGIEGLISVRFSKYLLWDFVLMLFRVPFENILPI